MSDGLQIIVGVLIGYLIGTFPSADLVARLASRGAVDIRAAGSGNPGGLNAARVLGKGWGLLVIVIDTVKGAIAGVRRAGDRRRRRVRGGDRGDRRPLWPVYNGFRGGKGWLRPAARSSSVFPPMVPIDGLDHGAVAFLGKSRGSRSRSRW